MKNFLQCSLWSFQQHIISPLKYFVIFLRYFNNNLKDFLQSANNFILTLKHLQEMYILNHEEIFPFIAIFVQIIEIALKYEIVLKTFLKIVCKTPYFARRKDIKTTYNLTLLMSWGFFTISYMINTLNA